MLWLPKQSEAPDLRSLGGAINAWQRQWAISMMLKFSAEQLTQLQKALTPHPTTIVVAPEIPHGVPFGGASGGKRPPPEAEVIKWEFRIPGFILLFSYGVLGLVVAVCSLLRVSHPESFYPVVSVVLLLQASTSRSKGVLTSTLFLIGCLFYLETPCMPCVQLWCVGLSVLFVLHSRRPTQLVAGMGLIACICSCVATMLYPSLPHHIQFGGTFCSLAIGSVAASVAQQRGEIHLCVKSII